VDDAVKELSRIRKDRPDVFEKLRILRCDGPRRALTEALGCWRRKKPVPADLSRKAAKVAKNNWIPAYHPPIESIGATSEHYARE